MSSQITTAFVNSYTDQTAHLLQQKGSKLYGKLKKKMVTGNSAKVLEQIGKQSAYEKTSRNQDVVYQDTPHAARWAHPREFVVADIIDTIDELKVLIDTPSAYAEAQAMGMGRQLDLHVVQTIIGTAYTGQNGTTTEAFDTANQQIAAASQGLTFAKLVEAREILMSNDWDDANDPLMLLIGSKQYDDLMNMTQVTSGDFNRSYVLENGIIKSFLGFEIVRLSNDILTTSTGATVRDVIAFPKSAYVLGEWNSMSTKIDEIPTKHHATQVLTSHTFGGTRTENGKVVQILCSEA